MHASGPWPDRDWLVRMEEFTTPARPSRPSVGGHDDPVDEAPWALQLVVRVEKSSPPGRTETCEAAGTAVVRLLEDPRAVDPDAWAPAVDRWTTGRIRKHCRRARGAAWARVQDLPGVTVEHAGAEVRALVPMSTAGLPKAVSTLQLSGHELDDVRRAGTVTPTAGGPVVVSLCPDPVLSLGKAAAAAGHAAQLSLGAMGASRAAAWAVLGHAVVVEQPSPARWAALVRDAQVVVADAGFTEVVPGTVTAVARWV